MKKWSKYNHIIPSERYGFLLFNTMNGCLLCIDKDDIKPFIQLSNVEVPDISQEDIDNLSNLGFLVEEHEDELNCAWHINEVLRRRYDPTVMNLTIAVTRDCNFNCIYCYETDRPAIYMDERIEEAIIQFVKSNKSLKALNVVWYGGEPLMNFRSISRLTKKFLELGIEYTAEIITNGSLLSEAICKQFASLKINKAQITLDGFEDIHNSRRPFRNGGPTYNRIETGIECLLKNHPTIHINIRSNIDIRNKESFHSFHKYILERFANDSRVESYTGFVEDILNSGCSAENLNISNLSQKSDYMVQNTNNGVAMRLLPEKCFQTCIANNCYSFLIDPLGEIYRCWIAMCDKKYKLGNVLDVKNFDYKKDALFMSATDYIFDEKCRNCSVFPICDGGCPLKRIKSIFEKGERNKCYSNKLLTLGRYLELYCDSLKQI